MTNRNVVSCRYCNGTHIAQCVPLPLRVSHIAQWQMWHVIAECADIPQWHGTCVIAMTMARNVWRNVWHTFRNDMAHLSLQWQWHGMCDTMCDTHSAMTWHIAHCVLLHTLRNDTRISTRTVKVSIKNAMTDRNDIHTPQWPIHIRVPWPSCTYR